MNTLNKLLNCVGELLLAPFQNYPATGLVFWSVVTGIVMTYFFGKTSNQRGLRRAADRIRAQLFAIKLFRDDLVVTFQCQVTLLKSTAMRLLHSIPPMLIMLVPLLWVLAQLAMRYEYRPFVQGEQAVVALHIKPGYWREMRDVVLDDGEQFDLETDALRDEHRSTIYWRIRVVGSESELLKWHVGDGTVSKELPISPTCNKLLIANPKRPNAVVWEQLLYPAEPSLSATLPVESIEIQLTPRETLIFGWNIPWWGTFFLVSVVIAFVAGKFMGVQY